MGFRPDQLYRETRGGVGGASAGGVPLVATRWVVGDADIERTVGAAEDADEEHAIVLVARPDCGLRLG